MIQKPERERDLHSDTGEPDRLAQLTRSVAHDLSNLVMAIQGSVIQLREKLAGKIGYEIFGCDELDAIEGAAAHASQLVARLRDAEERSSPGPLEVVDLDRTLHASQALLRSLLREAIGLDLDLQSSCHVSLEKSQLAQVLVNLTTNARDAMPRGGRLMISTRRRSLPAGAAMEVDLPPGEYAELRLEDGGVGMDPATLRQAFVRGFTTREARGGTGLGLHTVRRIVRSAGGEVQIVSFAGSGTRVHILLPCREHGPATRSTADERAGSPAGLR